MRSTACAIVFLLDFNRVSAGSIAVDIVDYVNDTSQVLACEAALRQILDPAFSSALAIANDASSDFNLDAFQIMSSATGYPGPIGDYGECEKVSLFVPSPNLAVAEEVFDTHLCLAGSIELNTSMALPPFGGVCVPEACGPDELVQTELLAWIEEEAGLLEQQESHAHTPIHYLHNLMQISALSKSKYTGYTCGTYKRPNVGVDAMCVLIFMGLLVLFIAWATLQDLVRDPDYPEQCPAEKKQQGYVEFSSRPPILSGSGFDYEEHVSKYLAAFSIPRNLNRLFTAGRKTELSVFEGLKVISMMWVVLGHILAVQTSIGYTDPEVIYPPTGIISKPEGELFFSARFAVDTFFFLSGFLVVYVMLKRFSITTREGKPALDNRALQRWPSWLPFFYFHRFLRILPSYLFCLLFWWKVAVFMGNGPFWYRWEYFIGLCDRFWWSNVLFVNNLVPWHMGETFQCFYHTWYLANDMQFYILSPFFILLYARKRMAGIMAVGIVLLVSTIAMIIGTVTRNWSALTLDGSWTIKYSQETYTMPWFRIVPYLMGMSFAMYWNERSQSVPHLHFTNLQRHLMIGSAIFVFIFITFSGYSGYRGYPCPPFENPDSLDCGSGWGVVLRSVYNAGMRPLWCFALMLLCLPCFNNQGGLIQQMLSHSGWVPLARLSFGAYLLHPVVINLWFLNSTTKFYFSRLEFIMTYIGVTTVTFGSALVLNLLVEAPLTALGKHLEHYLKVFHHRENEEGGGYDAAAQSPTTMESRTIASFANGPIGRVIPSAVDVEREGLFSAIGGTKKSGGYRSFEQIN